MKISGAPLRIKLLSSCLFLIGVANGLTGVSHVANSSFLVMGLICVLLSVGILKLWNWARIILIAFSFAFILLIYLPLVVGTFRGYWQGWGGLGVMVHFPLFVTSILCITTLLQPKIADRFRGAK